MTMSTKIRVAVIQLHSVVCQTLSLPLFYVLTETISQALDIEGNFTKACAFIRQTASQGAQLVVLPECVFYYIAFWSRSFLLALYLHLFHRYNFH